MTLDASMPLPICVLCLPHVKMPRLAVRPRRDCCVCSTQTATCCVRGRKVRAPSPLPLPSHSSFSRVRLISVFVVRALLITALTLDFDATPQTSLNGPESMSACQVETRTDLLVLPQLGSPCIEVYLYLYLYMCLTIMYDTRLATLRFDCTSGWTAPLVI
jgi:hypothetical protein